MKKIILFVGVFLLVSACKKPLALPEPEITTPHFYVTCSMDGQPLSIEAGNEDYYMNASWFRLDSSAMNVYKANLAKKTGAGYQVTILINDFKNSIANELMRPDSALSIGAHLYNDQNTAGLMQVAKFTPVKPRDQASYSWLVTDGITTTRLGGTGQESDYSVSSALEVNKTYSITFNYDNFLGVCTQSLTNVFKVGSPLQTAITFTRDMSALPEFKYKFGYTLPSYSASTSFDCLWEFAFDQTSSVNSLPTKVFAPNTTSLVKLRLTDKKTNESCVSYYQLNATKGDVCDANYGVQFLPVHNIRQYSSVTVLLTDASGKVFSSQNMVQPQTSNFQILNVENYANNDKGESTKRLTVKFNCVVKNGTSEINLKDGNAIVAVAHN